MRIKLKFFSFYSWGFGRCLILFSRELNYFSFVVVIKVRCFRGSRGGGDI